MTHSSNIAFANSLSANDAKSLYEGGITRVIDLRCAPCESARAIEENVVRRLENYRIAYEQRPMDRGIVDWNLLAEFRSMPVLSAEEVMLVTDIPVEIARELYLQSEADIPSRQNDALLAVA